MTTVVALLILWGIFNVACAAMNVRNSRRNVRAAEANVRAAERLGVSFTLSPPLTDAGKKRITDFMAAERRRRGES